MTEDSIENSALDPSATPEWAWLSDKAARMPAIRKLLEEPRPEFVCDVAGIRFDFSRQRIDGDVLSGLVSLARACHVDVFRDRMFAGEPLNSTEKRAVLHTALRSEAVSTIEVDGRNVVSDVHEVLNKMSAFAEAVRSGEWTGISGRKITDVVNIGIGGSDLGPAMAYQALRAYSDRTIAFHFVSNVDPTDVHDTLKNLNPETTMFIVASKTFTTQETMANARVSRSWIVDALGEMAVERHFVAVSTAIAEAGAFGIQPEQVFGFWDWVGGRYSLCSAIGLSTMIAIGSVNFRSMLDGFRAMDHHFATAPMDANVPMLMGLVAVWNRNFLDIATTAVLPYSQALSRLPAYLQQLTMESNGKSVRRDGEAVTYRTGAIYWGEPGTNGQHSFYQLLHQGTDDVAADLIVVAQPTLNEPQATEQHDMLVANALAQASVLSCGLTAKEARESGAPVELVAHKVMPGNRPVSLFLLPRLSPFELGVIIAAYEHSVFVQGALWQINSFDQWGVELGKTVAQGILEDIRAGTFDDPTLDSATREALRAYLDRKQA